MNYKKCPECGSGRCIRKGFQQGVQRWYCKDCQKKFQANRERLPPKEALFCLFVFNKQTLRELNSVYHIKTSQLQQMFDSIILPKKIHTPRAVSVCIDACYFGSFCVIAIRDQSTKENLWWCFTSEEKLHYYREGIQELQKLGYIITSITADGFPGIPLMYKDIPFQYCHFHARKTITSYITKKPKTEAGIALLQIMKTLTKSNKEQFDDDINTWFTIYKTFLSEITIHLDGRKTYTHIRLVKALQSIKHMSQYLFTYQKHSMFCIPRTTNTLEGFWKHIRIRVNCHNGLSLQRKQKVIELIMLYSTTVYIKDMEIMLY